MIHSFFWRLRGNGKGNEEFERILHFFCGMFQHVGKCVCENFGYFFLSFDSDKKKSLRDTIFMYLEKMTNNVEQRPHPFPPSPQ